ncbi:DinB family protein [Fictibacillus barbaricus]|uniref:Damage-inducible protein DinB n=1 Tax=Fictibacillus barbaricus TaxID=182136 RepID=A0ABU1TWE6_9BACL|nr:DinB family protein [Fictibacillus barbaricus]MDR7071539.1 putative damage-inducible protein DinB [Fictibacillus barbaricus]
MDNKTVLMRQMEANHNEPNWFVPVEKALDGLTEEQASQKTGNSNSIWEIVTHLVFWNERYLSRFKGITPAKSIESNDESFEKEENENWEKTKQRLQHVLTDWKSLLKEADDEFLQRSAHDDRHDPWYSVIANINIHNAYHIGQIIEIRKTTGNWDPKNGVH